MPLDDFRRLIQPDAVVDLNVISDCAERYRVSLIATVLRWLSYTEKRAVLVVSRDGIILWARSSAKALRTGASLGPIAVPVASLAAQGLTAQGLTAERQTARQHDGGIWLPEPVLGMTVLSEQYDFAISLLLLPNDPPPFEDRFGGPFSRFANRRTA